MYSSIMIKQGLSPQKIRNFMFGAYYTIVSRGKQPILQICVFSHGNLFQNWDFTNRESFAIIVGLSEYAPVASGVPKKDTF